jgi:serine/threonine protein kinase
MQTAVLQQTNQIFEMLTNANQKSKLDANNQQMLNEWIEYSGTIHSSTIEIKDIISEEGANGVVHKGIKDGHMEVAVKVFIIPHAELCDSIKNEALREAFIGMSFQHPNIVRTLGCVYDQKPSANMPTGNIMIIMEYMNLGSLHQFIRNNHSKLSKAYRHTFISDAANGIYEMHLKNKCHHDIKPGNMLIDDRYNVKICDLDSVKDLQAAKSKTTKSTVGVHTKQYTAPEYLKGGIAYNYICDVFSFAMSMYEVATGKKPFKGMTPDQIANELMSKDSRPPIPDNMRELVDGKYIKLMKKAWSTDPNDRPSMKEIVQEMQKICKASGVSKVKIHPGPSSQSATRVN